MASLLAYGDSTCGFRDRLAQETRSHEHTRWRATSASFSVNGRMSTRPRLGHPAGLARLQRAGFLLGGTTQFFYASDNKCWYEMAATFSRAELDEGPVSTGEDELCW